MTVSERTAVERRLMEKKRLLARPDQPTERRKSK
jgi:hypothetical protein